MSKIEVDADHYVKFYNSWIKFVNDNEIIGKYFNAELDKFEFEKIEDVAKIFHYFIQIRNTFNRLGSITEYISWTPRTRDMDSRFDFLLYHLENHYHEMYILKERLIALFNVLPRFYDQHRFYKKLQNSTDKACKTVSNKFKKYTNVRSEHVHSNRISKEEINKFNKFKFLLENTDIEFTDEAAFAMYNDDYKELKKDWTAKLENRTVEAYEISDQAFSYINPIVINNEGDLIQPNK